MLHIAKERSDIIGPNIDQIDCEAANRKAATATQKQLHKASLEWEGLLVEAQQSVIQAEDDVPLLDAMVKDYRTIPEYFKSKYWEVLTHATSPLYDGSLSLFTPCALTVWHGRTIFKALTTT